MPKNIYVGVDGIARLVNNIYVGVDGKARRVTRAYIGVDGKARVFFEGDSLPYFVYLYNDGSFVIQDVNTPNSNNQIIFTYNSLRKNYPSEFRTPWNSKLNNITTVSFNGSIEIPSIAYYFKNAQNLLSIDIRNCNTTNMAFICYNCQNLTSVSINDNIINMDSAYFNCINLTGSPVCSSNVINMSRTYENCRNLTGSPVCENNVTSMIYTYWNCSNLTGSPVCGNNVIYMNSAYFNCSNLTGSPVCGPDVINMSQAYWHCSNLTGEPVCGPNVIYMSQAYKNCINLIGSPICGPNVTDMAEAYQYCYKLTGSPICGDKITNMSCTYKQCFRITGSPVCGNNVINMCGTYTYCHNLTGSPICGDKVQDMANTYEWCENLTGSPVCGNNVVNMTWAYSRCSNLCGPPVCGPNVTNMSYTYAYCTNLCGNMYMLSTNVSNLSSCFYYRNNSRVLNIYVQKNSISFNTISNSQTWITNGDSLYNSYSNICVYPVDNIINFYSSSEDSKPHLIIVKPIKKYLSDEEIVLPEDLIWLYQGYNKPSIKIENYNYSIDENYLCTFTCSYAGIEYSTSVQLIVSTPSLNDFTYNENNDGTYTLTDWNGTLGGVEDTRIIIPKDNKIIL